MLYKFINWNVLVFVIINVDKFRFPQKFHSAIENDKSPVDSTNVILRKYKGRSHDVLDTRVQRCVLADISTSS